MPILFCNISWMEHYAGRTRKDPPLGGGGFPVTEGYCGEECNFVPCEDGFVYGHFETIKGEVDRQIRIERLGANRDDAQIDGVDVVWTAPREGRDPRTVVGWSRNATLYRQRQRFGRRFPSKQHRKAEIGSYRVRARCEDVFLLPVEERKYDLDRGRGWSGQASWWYADDTTNPEAAEFVAAVRERMESATQLSTKRRPPKRIGGRAGRAGSAAADPYLRYVAEYEVVIHPRHHRLQDDFKAHLIGMHKNVEFPNCMRDDLRYVVKGREPVMVEVKPSDATNTRYAIRTAIGQLLDYRQEQDWTGPQLIVVGAKVSNEGEIRLAIDNGFGLAWPLKRGFKIVWPGEVDRP